MRNGGDKETTTYLSQQRLAKWHFPINRCRRGTSMVVCPNTELRVEDVPSCAHSASPIGCLRDWCNRLWLCRPRPFERPSIEHVLVPVRKTLCCDAALLDRIRLFSARVIHLLARVPARLRKSRSQGFTHPCLSWESHHSVSS